MKTFKDLIFDGEATYKEINCSFLKHKGTYSFNFKDGLSVTVYEGFSNCPYEKTFTNKTNIYIDPFTITTCYGAVNKIVVGQLKVKS